MQANKSPEWKDDAAFWDDAWKDMQQRLDGEPQKRRPVLWWWLGLGTVLLVLAAATFWFLPPFGNESSTPETTPVQSREASVVEAPIAASENVTSVTEATAKLIPGEGNHLSSPAKAAAQLTPTRRKGAKENATRLPATDASNEDLQPAAAQSNISNRISNIAYPQAISPTPKAAAQLTPNKGNLSPPPLQRRGAKENAARLPATDSSKEDLQSSAAQSKISNRISDIAYPQAVSLLPGEDIRPLPSGLVLPEVSPIAQRSKSRFELLAGGTLSAAFAKPGYFAGLSYTLPSRAKISFPVSLRYRFDAIEITGLDGSRLSPVTNENGQQVEFDENQAAEELLSNLAINNFNELRTSSLELRFGMAWRAASRLRLSGHGGLQYLFSARGPSISSQDNTFADLSGTGRYVNLDVGGLFSSEFDLVSSPAGTPNIGNASPIGVNRWALRAGLNVNYQLTGRLGVFAGGQYLLTPIYQQQVAELRKTQLEAGVSWRLW
ncbi:hypothetical protein [Neolewinella agarilytica]|uniref:hypothetical protein n=1 Tax=Neolewinella agarilytica TaxID=478744 RepID=UPI0023533C1E|nr:hypothetical protein [Neolewinella agarilytica]